ncbi:MAG: hypothetical protein PUG33_06045 [Mollicutes bacterium]|mgnify:FL=1|nr:hypothetical protein [Mollicutes bacterium]
MIVKIFTLKKGLRKLEDVSAIRIKSKDYNLLILKDYIAIMGRITGEFSIEVNDDIIEYKNVDAYYVNSNNEFNVIIDGE